MTLPSITAIHSRDYTFVKDLRRLAQDTTAYRKQGRVWLEGDHLCRAAMERGQRASIAVFSESFWPLVQVEWAQTATKIIVNLHRVQRSRCGHEPMNERTPPL